MGREIRRVPPHWEHPRYTKEDAPYEHNIGEYRSCHDEDYETASRRWKFEFAEWEAGTHKSKANYEFWEYESPPDPELCRPKFTEEPTWWQVYQTVSEGMPVSPAFATADELIDYLAVYGDEYDQKRDSPPPSRIACEKFVKSGWVPSAMLDDQGWHEGIKAAETFKD